MSEHQQIQQSKKPESSSQRRSIPANQMHISSPATIIQRARINPKSLTSADVLQLQRTIGNRAVGRLLSEIRNPSTVQQGTIQRQEIPEEEEPLQGKFESKPKEECSSCMQRQEIPEEEEPIQGKMIGTIQRQEIPEEEPLQTKRENNTGMPDNLKAGVESLSGIDMSDVRVHYNSSKPAEVGALAYTQGTNIHVAPGQEKHLPHEAWHVVQQAQGRVMPTMQLKDVAVNNDVVLENEADIMGAKALQMKNNAYSLVNQKNMQSSTHAKLKSAVQEKNVVQLNYTRVIIPYNSVATGQAANSNWAISDNLTVCVPIVVRQIMPTAIPHITIAYPRTITHTSNKPEIHNIDVSGDMDSQVLHGGITYIVDGPNNTIVEEYAYIGQYSPRKENGPKHAATHTEPQFMRDVQNSIQNKISTLNNVRGIIIEIRQTLTPCANCQKILSNDIERVRTAHPGISVIIRASAHRLYDVQYGPLGMALSKQETYRRFQMGTRGALSVQGDPLASDFFGVHGLLS